MILSLVDLQFFLSSLKILGVKPRLSCTQSRCTASEPQPSPHIVRLIPLHKHVSINRSVMRGAWSAEGSIRRQANVQSKMSAMAASHDWWVAGNWSLEVMKA